MNLLWFDIVATLIYAASMVCLLHEFRALTPEARHERQTVPMLLAENKALEQLDALRIIAITNGIPGLVRLFDFQKSFAENLPSLFVHDSAYFRYAESELRRSFRTPETYNILLYGMATGHNRISQLSEFSGFPQNKCDKYLKALDKAELLESVQKKDAAGHVRTHYYPKGGY